MLFGGGSQGKPNMSKVRVLVGTKKGAFILTADGARQKWNVSGPHFAGWEVYHFKPATPKPPMKNGSKF